MNNEELVRRIQQGEDRKANLALLWEQNQGLIDAIVGKLTGLQNYEDGFEDVKQQSYFGILEAVERFRPEYGNKFFTYAQDCIKKAIYRYHANVGYVVRVPEYLRVRMKKYVGFCQGYKVDTGKWPDDAVCLEALHLSRKSLSHLQKLYCEMQIHSLDEKTKEGERHTFGNTIADKCSLEETVLGSVYLKELHETLSKAIGLLLPEEKEILLLHFYQGYPVKAIGEMKHISRQTVYNRLEESYQRIRKSYKCILKKGQNGSYKKGHMLS